MSHSQRETSGSGQREGGVLSLHGGYVEENPLELQMLRAMLTERVLKTNVS